MDGKKKQTIIYETPDGPIEFDVYRIVTNPNNLKISKITKDDIVEIKPAFFDISDKFYTEVGVAKQGHPTPGSFGFDCIIKSGQTISLQVISYYDFNLERDHGKGNHWNNGGRIIDAQGVEHFLKKLPGVIHKIDKDYDWIKWTMDPGPENKPQSVKINKPDKPLE